MAKGVKKSKRISVNALEKIAKEVVANEVTEEWHGIEVTIRKTLPLSEVLEFVNEIESACLMDDSTVLIEVFDFMVKRGIVTRYATFNLPENLEKQYELIYSTGVADFVEEFISFDQIQEIRDATLSKINRRTETGLNRVISMAEGLLTHFSERFGEVDGSELKAILDAFGQHEDGGSLEERMVSLYADKMDTIAEQKVEKMAEALVSAEQMPRLGKNDSFVQDEASDD